MAGSSSSSFPHFGTRCIHAGQDPEQWECLPVVPPIFTNTTYKQHEPGKPPRFDYIRDGNPTKSCLEKCLAACENTKHAFVYSSGLAATSTVLQATMQNGDHLVSIDDVYGGTNRYFNKVANKGGITNSMVDVTNPEVLEKAIQANTKLVWIESPTNPTLKVVDIKAVADVVHKKGCLLVVDNTFLSPYFQRPIDLGADIVLHSITKYINGHCDVLMGCLCTNNDELAKKFRFLQLGVGAVPGPFDCYLANRGLKTLHVRMRQHQSNAFAVTDFLEKSPLVDEVIYPGLPSHPQHELAKKQTKGFGGMVSFRIKGTLETAKKFINSLKLITLAESLGGVESLVEIPSLMTHTSVPEEERKKLGITDTLVRLSVGLEEPQDIVDDLDQALKAAQ